MISSPHSTISRAFLQFIRRQMLQLAQADVSEGSGATFRAVDKPFQIKYPRGGGCVCIRYADTSSSAVAWVAMRVY
jgi:hypothetical protein